MPLPLHELAQSEPASTIVRLTENGLEFFERTSAPAAVEVKTSLIPSRPLAEGEQYRFHFDMTKCIGCRSCEIACNEQNNTPPDLRWRRVGEIEGGAYPDVSRHYLSMGCNHCLTADCVKGCPVNAYTKDPVTGIVLHSAEACIGCQYCVWNCPYSVPQFNPERGVVGKCDMCHSRLTTGLEPACVHACPENAIEIEIVNQAAWAADFALAEAPGMPAAQHTISTTRITLPPVVANAALERVDMEIYRPEHPHWSLVWMTTLIQLSAGALLIAALTARANDLALLCLLALTAFTLSISTLHLGRPAYAWRALKAWRRSWLSREVLCFGLFFASLTALTAASILHIPILALEIATLTFGFAGILAGAFIYLVPARPAWNLSHTPIDFILSALMLGTAAAPVLARAAAALHHAPLFALLPPPIQSSSSTLPFAAAALLWSANLYLRRRRLERAPLYELRASAALLRSPGFRDEFLATFVLAALALIFSLFSSYKIAFSCAFLAVIVARYLFFVSVVPLNMALTFTRGGHR